MAMNREVIVTCAVNGGTQSDNPHVPITPEQIANAAIEAAEAGAAVAHMHVREPETGKGSHDTKYYREVVERLRAANTDILINLTTGMGSSWLPNPEDPMRAGAGSFMLRPEDRTLHVQELKPDLCSLNTGSLNFHGGAGVTTLEQLRIMAEAIRESGTKPEIEIFDMGYIRQARQLIEEGLIVGTPLFQLCMGVPWAAEADPRVLALMRDSLPEGSIWASFAISRMQIPWVAQSILMGGHVRVGLEDNLYIARGQYASNGELVEKAVHVIEALGARAVSPDEARKILGLKR